MSEAKELIPLIDERVFDLLCRAVSGRGANFRLADLLDAEATAGERLEHRASLQRLLSRMGLESQPPLAEGESTDERRLIIRQSPDEAADEVRRLMREGESWEVEFKSSMYYAHGVPAGAATLKQDELRDEVLKSICALLNSDGGTVLVGVSNKGEALGIEHDLRCYPTWPTGSAGIDKWLEALMSQFDKFSSPDGARIRVKAIPVQVSPGCTVAVLKVLRYPRIMSVRVKRKEGGMEWICFVRRQNASRVLRPDEIAEYVLARLGLSNSVGQQV
jgi:hypothetical protein